MTDDYVRNGSGNTSQCDRVFVVTDDTDCHNSFSGVHPTRESARDAAVGLLRVAPRSELGCRAFVYEYALDGHMVSRQKFVRQVNTEWVGSSSRVIGRHDGFQIEELSVEPV